MTTKYNIRTTVDKTDTVPVVRTRIATASAVDGNPGTGAYAIVVQGLAEDGSLVLRRELTGVLAGTTNIRIDQTALIAGLSYVRETFPGLPIYVLSTFHGHKDAVYKWAPKWAKHGWKDRNGDEVKNRDNWEQLLPLFNDPAQPVTLHPLNLARREPLWNDARAIAKDMLLTVDPSGVPVVLDDRRLKPVRGAASQKAWDMVRIDADQPRWTWTIRQIAHDCGVSPALVSDMRQRLQYLMGYDMKPTGVWAEDRGRALPYQV